MYRMHTLTGLIMPMQKNAQAQNFFRIRTEEQIERITNWAISPTSSRYIPDQFTNSLTESPIKTAAIQPNSLKNHLNFPTRKSTATA